MRHFAPQHCLLLTFSGYVGLTLSSQSLLWQGSILENTRKKISTLKSNVAIGLLSRMVWLERCHCCEHSNAQANTCALSSFCCHRGNNQCVCQSFSAFFSMDVSEKCSSSAARPNHCNGNVPDLHSSSFVQSVDDKNKHGGQARNQPGEIGMMWNLGSSALARLWILRSVCLRTGRKVKWSRIICRSIGLKWRMSCNFVGSIMQNC